MAQAAFLSALVRVEVAEVASHAAVKALSDQSDGMIKEHLKSLSPGTNNQEESGIAANGNTEKTMDAALVEAHSQFNKEDDDLEKVLSGIAVKIKEIQDKVVDFKELDLQVEKEWQQLQQLKNLVFVNQLTLMFRKAAAQKAGENAGEDGLLVSNVMLAAVRSIFWWLHSSYNSWREKSFTSCLRAVVLLFLCIYIYSRIQNTCNQIFML